MRVLVHFEGGWDPVMNAGGVLQRRGCSASDVAGDRITPLAFMYVCQREAESMVLLSQLLASQACGKFGWLVPRSRRSEIRAYSLISWGTLRRRMASIASAMSTGSAICVTLWWQELSGILAEASLSVLLVASFLPVRSLMCVCIGVCGLVFIVMERITHSHHGLRALQP